MERFDLVIAGAGCAGLSLAVRIAERGLGGRRLLVVDPRASHLRDRTWCFWDVVPHPFEEAVTHRWTRWRVAAPRGEVTVGSHRSAYCHVPSDAFYALALDRLARAGVEVRLGVGVSALEPDADGVTVRTTAGELRCGLAFDGRPPRLPSFAPPGDVRLLQHFKGLVIHAARPAFDPATVTLMDFALDGAPNAHFVYVLPYDERTALVEDTWMTASPHDDATYDRALDAWLRRSVGAWDVLAVERGVLPMTTERLGAAPPAPGGRRGANRVVPLGLRAGAARPSTGYAFLAIQQAAATLAPLALAGDPIVPPPLRPPALDRADRIFLSYLSRHPEGAPDLFFGLFRDTDPDRLVRFLSATGSVGDALAVVRASPALPFAREALRQLPGLARR